MRGKAGAFFIFFFWAGCVFAQVDLQPEMNPLNEWEILHNKAHKVKACTTFARYSIGKEYRSEVAAYNEQGRLLTRKQFNSRGETVEDNRYSYDKKGRMTYLKKASLELTFTYNRKGLKEVSGTHDAKPVQWYQSARTLFLFYKSELKKTGYTFDAEGRIIQLDEQNEKNLENDGDLLITYKYTKEGRLASIERKESGEYSDHSHTIRQYTYNQTGQLIDINHKMQNDFIWYEETTEYKYTDNRLVEIRAKNETDFAREIFLFSDKGLRTGRHYYLINPEAGGSVTEELSETLRYEYELR